MLAPPLLMVAEVVAHQWMRFGVKQLLERNLILENALALFQEIGVRECLNFGFHCCYNFIEVGIMRKES